MVEVRKQLKYQISFFSGIDFTIQAEKGLNGNCDFLISRSPELLILSAPVIVIVEAKKENIPGGLGQCVAEILAAQIFNQQHENSIKTIYGAVTTGSIWQFLKLEDSLINIDIGEYYLPDINQILGILVNSIYD